MEYKNTIKALILLLFVLFNTTAAMAQCKGWRYKVIRIVCGDVKNKNNQSQCVKEDTTFFEISELEPQSKDVVTKLQVCEVTNSGNFQYLILKWNICKQEWQKIEEIQSTENTKDSASKYSGVRFIDCGTKGTGLNDTENIVYDTVVCLTKDEIYIRNLSKDSKQATAILYSVTGDTISKKSMKITSNGYLLDRKLIDNYSEPFFLDIIETDKKRDWSYYVWRKLYVFPVPL